MNLFEARCCQWSWKFEGSFHVDICFTTIFQLDSNHHLDYTGKKPSGVCFRSIHDVHRDQCQDKVGTVVNGDPGSFIDDIDYQVVVFQYFVLSSLLGEMIQFDEHIFQMGWNQISLASLMTLQCQLT